MNQKANHHIDNQKKRHELYFKKLIIIVFACILGVVLYMGLDYYNKKIEQIGDLVSDVRKAQLEGAPIKAMRLFRGADTYTRDGMIMYLKDDIYKMPAPFHFEIADHYFQEEAYHDAQFWLFWGRFVLKYDAARCRGDDIQAWSNWFDFKYAFPVQRKLSRLGDDKFDKKQATQQSLERFLKVENEVERMAFPTYLCQYQNQPFRNKPDFVSITEWPMIRRAMRLSAIEFLSTVEEETETEDASDLNLDNPIEDNSPAEKTE